MNFIEHLYLPEELILAIFHKVGSSYAIETFQTLTLVNIQWNRISKDGKLTNYHVCYKCIDKYNGDHIGCLVYENLKIGNDMDFMLSMASYRGYLKMVKYLCNTQSVDIAEKISDALYGGHMKVVRYLCESQNIDINKLDEDILILSIKQGRLELIKYICESHNAERNIQFDNELVFCIACKTGDLEIIKYLCECRGADVYASNYMAVIEASNSGKLDVVKYLCETHKANIHFNNDMCVKEALKRQHLDIVKYLSEEKDRRR